MRSQRWTLIYEAAFLTITAATGSNADHGLRPGTRGFRQPIEQIAPNFRLAFKSRSRDFWEDCVYQKRAWTLECCFIKTPMVTF